MVELDVRTNALNLIRLVLALLVLVAHGFYLAGQGPGPSFRGENLGGWAVFGFFTISGYLITASRFANPLGRFLALRVARIYPAFVVCLVVTAGVFAPVAWWVERGTWDGFLTTPTTPLGYVAQNLGLRIAAYDVAGTPSAVPYPGAWNGSLWTLYFEFGCYLVVGLLVCLPAVRRHPWVIGLLFAVSVAAWATAPQWSPGGPSDLGLLAPLLPPFLGGALVQVVARRLPLGAAFALPAVAGSALLVVTVDGWGAQAASPLIAYAVLWLSTVLPSPALVRRHDVSYGAYIYAFPVQQLLAYAGAPRLGIVGYDVLAALATVALATVSWRLVERPALRWVRRRLPASTAALRSGGSATPSAPGHDVLPEQPGAPPTATGHGPRQQRHGVRP